jgi:hypothetical protein
MPKLVVVMIVMVMLFVTGLSFGLAWHTLWGPYEKDWQKMKDDDAQLEDLIRKYGSQREVVKPFECNPDTTPWTVGGWNVGRKQEICL